MGSALPRGGFLAPNLLLQKFGALGDKNAEAALIKLKTENSDDEEYQDLDYTQMNHLTVSTQANLSYVDPDDVFK